MIFDKCKGVDQGASGEEKELENRSEYLKKNASNTRVVKPLRGGGGSGRGPGGGGTQKREGLRSTSEQPK